MSNQHTDFRGGERQFAELPVELASERFLAQGASINARNAKGETALTLAARKGQVHMVEYLVNRGADPGVRDGSGRRAFDYVTSWSPWDFVIVDQKKIIVQYLTARAQGKSASMRGLAQALAQSRSHVWGKPVESGGRAYVVDLQVPFVSFFGFYF
jgi:Ankyrin repeats (many copies)